MNIHSFSTGTVRIPRNWLVGKGPYPLRLLRTLLDTRLSDPLPIWCFLIEHPEGLILIDTGITQDANKPVWFPPHMRLAQRAAPFQIANCAEEIGEQLRGRGFSPEDIRWVILTHLHQDHEGGLSYFPKAEFVVSRAEWKAAAGLMGRMSGYLNQRWPHTFEPTLVDFGEWDPVFGGRHTLTTQGDIYLVSTPGHSKGHLSIILEENSEVIFFAGDTAYSQALLVADTLDGVAPDAALVHSTHEKILALAALRPTVYLPSHEWDTERRLQEREPILLTDT